MRRELRAPGFTAIELLLAIGVTAILLATIVSAYRTQSVRGEVEDGLKSASRWQPVVEAAFRRSGQVPRGWDAVVGDHPSSDSPYVDSVALVDGRLDVTFGREASAPLAARRISLTPYETASLDIVWICGNAVPGPGLEPLGFASGGRQSVQVPATVETRYLAADCR
jgi:hypothetical protein